MQQPPKNKRSTIKVEEVSRSKVSEKDPAQETVHKQKRQNKKYNKSDQNNSASEVGLSNIVANSVDIILESSTTRLKLDKARQ